MNSLASNLQRTCASSSTCSKVNNGGWVCTVQRVYIEGTNVRGYSSHLSVFTREL